MEVSNSVRHTQLLRSTSAEYRAPPEIDTAAHLPLNRSPAATSSIVAQLKSELVTIVSDSALGKCVADPSFVAVMQHAVSTAAATAAAAAESSVDSSRTLPPTAVTTHMIEALVQEATHETAEYANSLAAATYDVPLEPLHIHLNERTLDPLRREVRDRDRGHFFSVLTGLLSNYIQKRCSTSSTSNTNGRTTGRPKRLRQGQRAKQLSDLVTRAVREDSLTDALVAVKALLCQCGTGTRGRDSKGVLQQSAVDALVQLGERFVPDVSALRRHVFRSWRYHRSKSWQSDPTLMFAWQGPSRTACEVRRLAQSHTYTLKGSNFVARGSGMCTSGMG